MGFIANLLRNKFISGVKRLHFFILMAILSLILDVFWLIWNSSVIINY